MEVPGLFCAPFCLLCSLLYCSLSSFVLLAPSVAACRLSSAPPCSPRECPCRTGPLYVPSWVPSFCPPPDSRLPSVAPGCGAAYSLLDSSLLPVLLATLFCPSSLSTGMPRPGGPPCMSRHGYPPSAFSRFPVPVRGTRLRRSLLSFGLFAPSGAVCLLS